MTCRCTANALTLFIRNVAHVDVPSSSRYAIRQGQRSANRNAIRLPASHSFSRRTYSSSPFAEDGAIEPKLKTAKKSAVVSLSLNAIDSILAESPMKSSTPRAAGTQEEAGYESPLKSLLKDMPQKKPKERSGEGAWTVKKSENATTFTKRDAVMHQEKGSRMTFRRTGGTGNTGLTIHYDNPRAPPRMTRGKEVPAKDDWVPPPREPWMVEKDRVKEKYPDGYNPLKKLSPDAMAGIRALHAQMPEYYTTWKLSQEFEVSPESIRRILKSKWKPDSEEETERQKRWFKRGQSVYTRYAELGLKPPKKWRDLGIGNGKPEWMLRRQMERDTPGPPALVTTARRTEQKYGSDDGAESSLADKIL